MMSHDAPRPPPPLPLAGSLLLFGAATLLLWAATRLGIPWLRGLLPGPDVLCWFVAGGAVFATLFCGAFVGFYLEAGAFTPRAFVQRFRLHAPGAGDIAWAVGLLVGCGVVSGCVAGGWKAIAQTTGWLPEPVLTPSFIDMEPITPATRWVLLAWLPLFFFNIFGEELWWRGYMLPREERQHQGWAFVAHGLGLTLFHLPLGVHLSIILLPYLFALPYVTQRRQNLWTSVLLHGLLNGGGFVAVAAGWA